MNPATLMEMIYVLYYSNKNIQVFETVNYKFDFQNNLQQKFDPGFEIDDEFKVKYFAILYFLSKIFVFSIFLCQWSMVMYAGLKEIRESWLTDLHELHQKQNNLFKL